MPTLRQTVEVLAGVNLPALIEACVNRDGETVSSLAARLQEIGRGAARALCPARPVRRRVGRIIKKTAPVL
ncbi:hypothetical protein KL86CLO1_12159 [uncultured Eubacteriales bacterium]|uniref:PTS EIIA type-4 domain-containing protein n=1 Tax=uncultured Eubacteriales bacterium TaxID=172733 RepID=A0A212K3Y7_9FIRM|nr:hypothetical protein KL86CLO1_12159 [uncultured Eubacteriales bacterium]